MTTQPIHAAAANSLSIRFGFRNPSEVLCYLEAYPFLVPLLSETYDAVHRYFGNGTQVLLEVMHDPEGSDQGGLLFAQIQSVEPAESTLAKMDRFDEEWWIDASERAECRLVVGVDYDDEFPDLLPTTQSALTIAQKTLNNLAKF